MGDFGFLAEPVEFVAPRLLGCHLIRHEGEHRLVGKIVEVEAYDQSDPASHTFRGPSMRNQVMFGEAGHLYVYFTYGMHFCMNIVTGPKNHGSAVLIRAVEPLEGLETMRENRGDLPDQQLTNGPAKLCQALNINKTFNGHDLHLKPLQLEVMPPVDSKEIVQTTRIGISRAVDKPWRYYLKDNPFVSKK